MIQTCSVCNSRNMIYTSRPGLKGFYVLNVVCDLCFDMLTFEQGWTMTITKRCERLKEKRETF